MQPLKHFENLPGVFNGNSYPDPFSQYNSAPFPTQMLNYPAMFATNGTALRTVKKEPPEDPKEAQRLADRRRRNKEAAARCRQKREDQIKMLTERRNDHVMANAFKEKEVDSTRKAVQNLIDYLQLHSPHFQEEEKKEFMVMMANLQAMSVPVPQIPQIYEPVEKKMKKEVEQEEEEDEEEEEEDDDDMPTPPMRISETPPPPEESLPGFPEAVLEVKPPAESQNRPVMAKEIKQSPPDVQEGVRLIKRKPPKTSVHQILPPRQIQNRPHVNLNGGFPVMPNQNPMMPMAGNQTMTSFSPPKSTQAEMNFCNSFAMNNIGRPSYLDLDMQNLLPSTGFTPSPSFPAFWNTFPSPLGTPWMFQEWLGGFGGQ